MCNKFITLHFIETRRILQGKGLMDTYWLTCKDGGITRSADFDVPTLFDDDQPMFIKRLREEYYI
jgi:hypothetical protein